MRTDGQSTRLVGVVRADAEGYGLEDSAGTKLARLRAGAGIALELYRNQTVAVHGQLHLIESTVVLIVVEHIATLFDVTLSNGVTTEDYAGVTIGVDGDAADSLINQIYVKTIAARARACS